MQVVQIFVAADRVHIAVQALKDYDFRVGKGLYCDMNAIRRDEDLDNLHSIYVDPVSYTHLAAGRQRRLPRHGSFQRKALKLLKTN